MAVDMNLKALGVTEEEVKKVGGEIILVTPSASLHLHVAVSTLSHEAGSSYPSAGRVQRDE